jgi:hypothetical protein
MGAAAVEDGCDGSGGGGGERRDDETGVIFSI